MHDLDRHLLAAWHGARRKAKHPLAAAKIARRAAGPTVSRPLRSWALVLRANDARIGDHCVEEGDEETSDLWVYLRGEAVRALCAWVSIPWPGVPPEEAARRFGVNVKTVHAWARKGIVRMDRYVKPWLRRGDEEFYWKPHARVTPPGVPLTKSGRPRRAMGKRGEILVWTRSSVDTGGVVWSGPWGAQVRELSRRVPLEFEQVLCRRVKFLPQGSRLERWCCPDCGEWVAKVYWAQRVRRMGEESRHAESQAREGGASGVDAGAQAWEEAMGELEGRAEGQAGVSAPARGAGRHPGKGFVCRRCADLIYESAERTSKAGRHGTANIWNRFVQRISGGVLRGRDVRAAERIEE